MVRYKVVFKDEGNTKTVYGEIVFEGELVKIDTDRGNTVYINRANITFMKELREGMH